MHVVEKQQTKPAQRPGSGLERCSKRLGFARFTFIALKSLSAKYAGTFFTHFTGRRRKRKVVRVRPTRASVHSRRNLRRSPVIPDRRPPGAPAGSQTSHSGCSPAGSSDSGSCSPAELQTHTTGIFTCSLSALNTSFKEKTL